jgi:hypothetical protein
MSNSLKPDPKVLLQRDGQSRAERQAAMPDPASAPVTGKAAKDDFEFVREFSKQVKYYEPGGADKDDTWEDFFGFSDEELSHFYKTGSAPAHLALMKAFIRLMDEPKKLLNGITRKHLDFFYREVLKFSSLEPVPDLVHVVFELKKNAVPVILKKGTLLDAGKGQDGKVMNYALQHDLVVNHSAVQQVRSIYRKPGNGGLYFAPVANSADGMGGEPGGENPAWAPFDNPHMPKARVGFALAGNVLLMKEGERDITVTLSLSGTGDELSAALSAGSVFRVNITGEDGWISTKPIGAEIRQGNKLQLLVSIPADEKAITGYNRELHGGNYETGNPVLLVLIENENDGFYPLIRNAVLLDARIDVSVKGVAGLHLENDFGLLDPGKPFMPFGPVPEKGSGFYIGYKEAFEKNLTHLALEMNWKNIPAARLANHYNNYKSGNRTLVPGNSHFSANVQMPAGGNWNNSGTVQLFDPADARRSRRIEFSSMAVSYPGASFLPRDSQKLSQLRQLRSSIVQRNISKFAMQHRLSEGLKAAPLATEPRKGLQGKDFMIFRLENGFLHKEYREIHTANLARYLKGEVTNLTTLREPLAPEMESLLLDYKASSGTVSFRDGSLESFATGNVELYHVGAFGEMREHRYQRDQLPFAVDRQVRLVPRYDDEGELLIGISGLAARDSMSLLFQVAGGSSNPDKDMEKVTWNVLCDNYWRQLESNDIISDDTMNFLRSGIIRLVLPAEATTSNTILPEGLIWLKASVKNNADAVCKMVDIHCNAAKVSLASATGAPASSAGTLPAGSISKMVNPVSAIKSVGQPYGSFGGRAREDDNSFFTRVSERLRHKDRGITLWDYERMVLQEFPGVYRVKCINHASPRSFYAPGNISLVLIPDLNNKNAADALRPRVDKATLKSVGAFLAGRVSDWVTVHVMNPDYEEIRLELKVKFRHGIEFNNFRPVLNRDIIKFLSPWVSGEIKDVGFTGKVHKSVVINHIESLEYVDYVTRMKMFRGNETVDIEFAEAANPRSVLVSAPVHDIKSV